MYSIEELVDDTHYFNFARYKNNIPEPMACAACGIHNKNEGWYFIATHGFHLWIQPSNEMILKRMKARRERRNTQ